jgi:hypothetical protein
MEQAIHATGCHDTVIFARAISYLRRDNENYSAAALAVTMAASAQQAAAAVTHADVQALANHVRHGAAINCCGWRLP